MDWHNCSTSARVRHMGALDTARAIAHQYNAARVLANESLRTRAHAAILQENASIYHNARLQNHLAQTVYHRNAIIEHRMNSHIHRVHYSRFGIPVRKWMRPDLLSYIQLQATLTPQELKDSVLKSIKLWKTSAKKSAHRFWGKLLLIFKKQEKIKEAVKSNFIPVKILFNSLRPIELAA